MKSEDRQFFNQFIEVIAILVLVAVGLYWLASALGGNIDDQADERRVEYASAQLEPEAMVLTESIATTAIKAPEPERTGAEMFADFGCDTCHQGSMDDAPVIGDTAAWQARLDAAGFAGLVNSVVYGKGNMSRMGGSKNKPFKNGTQQEFDNAVAHMLSLANIDVPMDEPATEVLIEMHDATEIEAITIETDAEVEAIIITQPSSEATPAPESNVQEQNSPAPNTQPSAQ